MTTPHIHPYQLLPDVSRWTWPLCLAVDYYWRPLICASRPMTTPTQPCTTFPTLTVTMTTGDHIQVFSLAVLSRYWRSDPAPNSYWIWFNRYFRLHPHSVVSTPVTDQK